MPPLRRVSPFLPWCWLANQNTPQREGLRQVLTLTPSSPSRGGRRPAPRTAPSRPGSGVPATAGAPAWGHRSGRRSARRCAGGAWGWARAGSSPAATAASFMLLLTHCRLISKRGSCRSRGRMDTRSPREEARSAGMGTSRPRLALLPVTSGRREMIGGSWLSRRSAGRRERHSPDPQPRPEHHPHGHLHRVAGCRLDQGRGLLPG